MNKKAWCKKVNELAKKNVQIAQGWIDCYNRDNGTSYFLQNGRVVFKVIAHGVETIHDGYTWA